MRDRGQVLLSALFSNCFQYYRVAHRRENVTVKYSSPKCSSHAVGTATMAWQAPPPQKHRQRGSTDDSPSSRRPRKKRRSSSIYRTNSVHTAAAYGMRRTLYGRGCPNRARAWYNMPKVQRSMGLGSNRSRKNLESLNPSYLEQVCRRRFAWICAFKV